MLVRALFLTALVLGPVACGGTDAIEFESDDKDTVRARPSWQEPGATSPVPSVTLPKDAGVDGAVAEPTSDAAAPSDAGTSDAGQGDAGSDAAAPGNN